MSRFENIDVSSSVTPNSFDSKNALPRLGILETKIDGNNKTININLLDIKNSSNTTAKEIHKLSQNKLAMMTETEAKFTPELLEKINRKLEDTNTKLGNIIDENGNVIASLEEYALTQLSGEETQYLKQAVANLLQDLEMKRLLELQEKIEASKKPDSKKEENRSEHQHKEKDLTIRSIQQVQLNKAEKEKIAAESKAVQAILNRMEKTNQEQYQERKMQANSERIKSAYIRYREAKARVKKDNLKGEVKQRRIEVDEPHPLPKGIRKKALKPQI